MPRNPSPEIRSHLLGSASKMFSRYGYRKTTVEDIAKEAGVGKGTVYLHFENKEEIFLEVVKKHAITMLGELRNLLDSFTEPEDKLREIICYRPITVWEIHEETFGQEEFIFPDIKMNRCEFLKNFEPIQQYVLLLQSVLEEGMEKNIFRKDDSMELAYHINLVTSSFLPPYRFVSSREEVVKQVNMFAEIFISGLKS